MPKAEIETSAVFKDAPVYIWYEWHTLHNQFTGARRVYMADAVARWSHELDLSKRYNVWRAATITVEVYVALGDDTGTWKLKGANTANETLDNLVMLFAMQNNISFEIERRLHGFASF